MSELILSREVMIKEIAALHRSVPRTRMLDYGMAAADATVMDALTIDSQPWPDMAEQLAEQQCHRARSTSGLSFEQRAQAYEWAAAALVIGQLTFNDDVPRKIDLYRRAIGLLEEAISVAHKEQATYDLQRLPKNSNELALNGWQITVNQPRGVVIIVGGLSGWGASYLAMARTLARQGMTVLMIEAPGQGETRMQGGLHLSHGSLQRILPYITYAMTYSPHVGMVGNSFGGMIVAHLSAMESRIAACCINGAASTITVPDFRTAREQMQAAFGVEGAALVSGLAEFDFDSAATPIRCPTLILEGGADPMVMPGIQANFLAKPMPRGSMVCNWPDGEHTIYNHAEQRNSLLAHWFAEQFVAHR